MNTVRLRCAWILAAVLCPKRLHHIGADFADEPEALFKSSLHLRQGLPIGVVRAVCEADAAAVVVVQAKLRGVPLGDELEEMFVRAEFVPEKRSHVGGGIEQQLQGGAVGGKPLAAGPCGLAARQQAVGALGSFGQAFARQAALPRCVGVRQGEADAVTQARHVFAGQKQAACTGRRHLPFDGFGRLQRQAVAAHQVEILVLRLRQSSLHQGKRGFNHAESAPADIDALRQHGHIGQPVQKGNAARIGFGIVMHIKMVLRRALRHQGQVVWRRVAKKKVGGTHHVQAAFGNMEKVADGRPCKMQAAFQL